MLKIIDGNLIALALEGQFDAIGHGVNCFCRQKSGIAKQMVETFGTNDDQDYWLERPERIGDKSKLGQIEGFPRPLWKLFDPTLKPRYPGVGVNVPTVEVYNCYTQFHFGYDGKRYLSYKALAQCMEKLDKEVREMVYPEYTPEIGLPWIGCGLAGGDRERVKEIIEQNIKLCNVTIVNYKR